MIGSQWGALGAEQLPSPAPATCLKQQVDEAGYQLWTQSSMGIDSVGMMAVYGPAGPPDG